MYYLIRKFKPLSVLEVGTHIGASTIHRKCEQTFGLIFLDGDHTAKTVYQEILAALRLLNKEYTWIVM